MKIALLSVFTKPYEELAKTTVLKNKGEYCNRHGYTLIAIPVPENEKRYISYFRLAHVLENINAFDWIWVLGADTMIMNYKIKVEDLCDPAYHFIMATDQNGGNADSIIFRNSEHGKAWLQFLIDNEARYLGARWKEQSCILDHCRCEPWGQYIKILPQKLLNSTLYKGDDIWQHGDFLIHWPGNPLSERIRLAAEYEPKVMR